MVDSNPSPFNESRALRLFPTFVWKADLRHEIFPAINQRIVARLDEMRRSLPRFGPGQAWQSDQELHRRVEFRDLVSRVNEVADGTLLVFPSWLHHSVDRNRSGEERISVSFDIMFSSYSETMSRPLWEAQTGGAASR